MNVRERLHAFLGRLYVPKQKEESFTGLRNFLENVTIRAPNENDAHKAKYTMLVIDTKGKGKRETFDKWSIKYVDFDSIGKRYALAYIYDSDGHGHPQRIDIQSSKNILII